MDRDRRPIVRNAGVSPDLIEAARQMRRAPTASEARAWKMLRARRCCGLKFRRQQVIGRFIVDFYCHELRLALEIDGSVHDASDRVIRDGLRSDYLRLRGITVVRIGAADITPDNLVDLLRPWIAKGPLSLSERGR